MPSLSRLVLALALPLLAACTVYTPAEYRYLEESRADSSRVNRAAAAAAADPVPTTGPQAGPSTRNEVRRSPALMTPVSLEESRAPRAASETPQDAEPTQG